MAHVNKQASQNKARLDKFILSFSVPQCLQSSATREQRATDHKSHERVIPDSLQYSIYGAIVPEISVPSVTLPQFAQHLKVSSHRRDAYQDVTVNFNIDNKFNNYWYIYRWLDILNDQHTAKYDDHGAGTSNSLGSQYHADDRFTEYDQNNRPLRDNIEPDVLQDYATNFSIYGLDEYNKEVIKFTYIRAFPVSLGEISYNYQTPDEITSSFSFSFSQLNTELM